MNKKIKEALGWVGRVRRDYESDLILPGSMPGRVNRAKKIIQICSTIRTALEEYEKPKTVTREWVDMEEAPQMRGNKLKELGIEVTGEGVRG